jgi:SPP1 family predicted phage head-tail adaptor
MRPKRTPVGARRRLFTLDLPLESPDGFGGVIRTFQPGPRVWGAIEALDLDERERAGRPEEAVTHRVRLRHRADVDGRMRLILGARRFRIRAAADPDGMRRETVCLVEEIKP